MRNTSQRVSILSHLISTNYHHQFTDKETQSKRLNRFAQGHTQTVKGEASIQTHVCKLKSQCSVAITCISMTRHLQVWENQHGGTFAFFCLSWVTADRFSVLSVGTFFQIRNENKFLTLYFPIKCKFKGEDVEFLYWSLRPRQSSQIGEWLSW